MVLLLLKLFNLLYLSEMSRTYIHKEKATYDIDKPEKLFRRFLNYANRWNFSRDECRKERAELREKIANRGQKSRCGSGKKDIMKAFEINISLLVSDAYDEESVSDLITDFIDKNFPVEEGNDNFYFTKVVEE